MNGAFEWIGWVAERIGQFIPRWLVVDTRHGAVKWCTVRVRDLVRFKWDPTCKVSVVSAGFVIYWPLFTELELYPIAYQTMPLVAQDIVTTDGRTVTARGVLAYEIQDLEVLLAHTFDPEDTVRDIAGTSFHDVLCHQSWDELQRGQGRTLDTKLKNEAQKDLRERGVLVHKFTLNSLAPARVLRVVQSTSTEGELR